MHLGVRLDSHYPDVSIDRSHKNFSGALKGRGRHHPDQDSDPGDARASDAQPEVEEARSGVAPLDLVTSDVATARFPTPI